MIYDRDFKGKAAIAAVQYEKEGEYWLKKFSGEFQKTTFPYDFNIKSQPEQPGKHNITFQLRDPYVSKLIELSKGLDYRLYIILTAGLAALLYKYTGNKDIVIGSPVFKQDKEGNFINTMLPLRNPIDGEMTFKELLLDQVRPIIIEANEHQNYPIETLLFQLNMPVTREEFPLFDVVILLENIHEKKYIHSVHPNMVFSFLRTNDSMEGKVGYNPALYGPATIDRIIHHFNHLMEQVVFNANIPLSQIDILSEEEKQQWVLEFNNTKTGYPAKKTIDELFAEQVSREPNSIALTYEDEQLTYRELNVQSEGLACYLHKLGVKLEEPVAVMVENAHNAVVAILGILKAGGIYLPVGAEYPGERKKYIVRDCNARILLTNFVESYDCNYISTVIDMNDNNIYKSTDDLTGYRCHCSDNLAYIMYTSGSTGVPKGVMVGHRNVVRLVKDTNYIEFREGNSILLTGVLEFDASTFEIWGALLNGLKLHLVSKYDIINHDKLRQTAVRNGINIMWMTSPLFNQMLDMDTEIFSGLKYLLVGGDALSPPHINKVKRRFPGLKVINGYGPTENTTFSTTYLVDKEHFRCIPIGKPIANSTAYILDQSFRLVPIGVSGELFVGGDGLSRGYLNNPELTFEKFRRAVNSHSSLVIRNRKRTVNGHSSFVIGSSSETSDNSSKFATNDQCPMTNDRSQKFLPNDQCPMTNDRSQKFLPNDQCPMTNDRFYKTGDLARWLPDGNIEFQGRIDRQIKIRGYRIEPGEIETLLMQMDFIEKAVITDRESSDGEKYLCAYVVAAREKKHKLDTMELRKVLSRQLPDYMVPGFLWQLDSLPLTPNGKVDKKALSRLEIEADQRYIAPRNYMENKMAGIFSEVLKIDREVISIDSNFFDLGGHSIRAMILISKLNKVLKVKIPLAELFKKPTIRQLIEYIGGLKANPFVSIGVVEKKEYYVLSSAQKRLYVLQQMELTNTAYNVAQALVLEGELNKKALENTFRQLSQRHESLRTFFAVVNAEPVQMVHEDMNFKIEYYDITRVEAGVKVESYEGTGGLVPLSVEPATAFSSNPQPAAALISSFIRPFDLSNAPLLRVGLIPLHTPPFGHPSQKGKVEGKHILMIDMHHIITDGTSMELFVKESMALYAGKKLPPLRYQYKDYAEWQSSDQQKRVIKEQEEYWVRQFADGVPVLNLSLDFPRPSVQSFEGKILFFQLSVETTRALKQLALHTGVTLYMVLLAIYNILLGKLSGQEDIIVGTPIAARRHVDLERIIGMFVNTLAMRNYPAGNKKFIDFLNELKKRTLEAFENQEYQFEDLVERVSVTRDISRNPIFDVLFGLQNMEDQTSEITAADISQLKIKPYEGEYRTAKFDLNLTCFENEDKLFCFFEYCTKLFKKETIERFFIYFKQILAAVLTDSNQKISHIEIITAEEKRQLLYDFNDTAAAYPREKTLQQLFVEQVERTSDHIALLERKEGWKGRRVEGKKEGVSFGQINAFRGMAAPDEYADHFVRPVQLTYRELNERSGRLACLLIEKGVKPDTIVGIVLERSLEMIIAILGILKAGGAYLPIDPDYPDERINYMLKDSGAKILVTVPGLSAKFEKLSIVNCQLLMVNEIQLNHRRLNNPPQEANSINNYQLTIHNSQLNSSSLAYVIYTSGTTGKPKGVLIQHRNVVRLMINDKFRLDFNNTDIWSLFHSICFDFSVWEIFGALFYGGKSIIIPKMLARDPDGFLDLLTVQKVTVLNQTPSAFYQLLDRSLKSPGKKLYLRYVIFGGEALNPARLKAWKEKFPQIKPVNMYGITETTVHVTYKEIEKEEMEFNTSNIGTPIPTLTVYVMDRYLNLLPYGVSGELCIGGQGVGRGYLNQPVLTAEKFLENPYIPGETIYRSGDLARRVPGGDLEYLGRIDQQVKIRGHRIELGEIECQLLKHPNVKETLVIVKEDKNSDKYLCLYIVPTSNDTFNASELREYLSGKLPEYMIPLYFISLAKFPLTPNGKIDRKTLPAPGITPDNYIAPQDKLEKKLVEIWSEVLGIEEKKISIDANFFELGGHSLKAASVISAIFAELDIRMPLIEIFRTPTVRQLARYIKNTEGKITSITDKNLVLLKKSTEGSGHLFFTHDGSGDIEGYIEFCKGLNIEVHCWGIRAAPLENYMPVNLSIESMAANYIKTLRKVQPHGPYSIVGWSLGGVIAFEMALQLETMGQKTTFLGLIDAPCPQMDGNDDFISFSLQTEVNLIINYVPNSKIKKRVENISDVNEVWPALIDYMGKNNIGVDTIKRLIPDELSRIIPNYNRIGTRGLIYYLNMHRTLTNALLRYLPRNSIDMTINYFKASQSPAAVKKGWYDYCKKSLEIHQVEGDHFSILRKPVVNQLKKIFIAALKKVYPC